MKDQDRTVPVAQVLRFGLGAEWQAGQKLNVAFSYEPAYTGDMPVNQNCGPLAGSVVGSFPSRHFNCFQVSFSWGGGHAQASI